MMNLFEIGTILNVDGMQAQVIGYIIYKNPADSNKLWVDYRLISDEGEFWLSWDEEYQEYSISWPSSLDGGMIDSKWHKVDEGTQVVLSSFGDVDVDIGETANFVEYEDETEEETLSLEIWEDGTEVSEGCYLDRNEIEFIGVKKVKKSKKISTWIFLLLFIIVVPQVLSVAMDLVYSIFERPVTIEQHISSSTFYEYITSVTGNENQKANVYRYKNFSDQLLTDVVARDIIDGIEGKTELVTENAGNVEDGSISIVTKKEYCLIYYPQEKEKAVYVQVSDRKYNYSSDNDPYHARKSTNSWYHRHYYSSAFPKDSSKWKSIPSSYNMYDGPIMQDLGNGYYDMYASSVRRSSLGSRSSDGGGFSGGK